MVFSVKAIQEEDFETVCEKYENFLFSQALDRDSYGLAERSRRSIKNIRRLFRDLKRTIHKSLNPELQRKVIEGFQERKFDDLFNEKLIRSLYGNSLTPIQGSYFCLPERSPMIPFIGMTADDKFWMPFYWGVGKRTLEKIVERIIVDEYSENEYSSIRNHLYKVQILLENSENPFLEEYVEHFLEGL